MRHAADARHALGQNDAACRLKALEPLLHAAMLEEQPRMIVQDRLTDVEEQKLGRLDHIGAHRTERQQLHVGLGARQFRNGRFASVRTRSGRSGG